MNKCKFCKCDDFHACRGGCFWVNNNQTICSSCAINDKVPFINKNSESKAIITEAFISNLGVLAVTVKYKNGRCFSYTLSAFMGMFTEVSS